MNETVLNGLRGRISEKDFEIIRLISERTAIAGEIGKIKSESGLDVRNTAAEDAVISRYVDEGLKYGFDKEDMISLAETVIEIAVKAENKEM